MYVAHMTSRTRLQEVLRAEGRKQTWLADRADLDPGHLSRIVNGLHPTDATARKIADALGRDVADLWPEVGEQAA